MEECGKYFELKTQPHKGAKSANTRAELPPAATRCEGVVAGNLARVYLSLREECGLELPMEEPGHMLPAPSDEIGKRWRQRYRASEEGAGFLNLVLSTPKKSGRRISLHHSGISLESRAIFLGTLLPFQTQQCFTQETYCPQCYVNMMQCCKPSGTLVSNGTKQGRE